MLNEWIYFWSVWISLFGIKSAYFLVLRNNYKVTRFQHKYFCTPNESISSTICKYILSYYSHNLDIIVIFSRCGTFTGYYSLTTYHSGLKTAFNLIFKMWMIISNKSLILNSQSHPILVPGVEKNNNHRDKYYHNIVNYNLLIFFIKKKGLYIHHKQGTS